MKEKWSRTSFTVVVGVGGRVTGVRGTTLIIPSGNPEAASWGTWAAMRAAARRGSGAMGAAALQQRLEAEGGQAGANAHRQEIGAMGGRPSPWTTEEDDWLMGKEGQAYMKKQKDAQRNPHWCAPPLDRHTIKEAYEHAKYLRRKERGQVTSRGLGQVAIA